MRFHLKILPTAAVLIATGIVSPGAITPVAAATRPTLATEDQIAAERLALAILASREIKAVKAKLFDQLRADPDAQDEIGRAQAAAALDQWAAYLTLTTAISDTDRPRVITITDNRQHRWGGREFPAVGLPISNPDNIYRSSLIDGESRYELSGHFGTPRPGQFSIELSRRSTEGDLTKQSKNFGDMGNQVLMVTDDNIKPDANGNFVITIDSDPANGRINHIQTVPGPLLLHYRDSLSNWNQVPAALKIRRIGTPRAPVPSISELSRKTADRLPGYVAFWQDFREKFLSKPAYNTLVGPWARAGGWGFAATGRFMLAKDEALVAIVHNDARYTGLQIADKWMVTPDPKRFMVSRNKGQSVADSDGRYTYVIAATDPGVANWIDTTGLPSGWLQFRWQGVPAGTKGESLLESYKVVKIADLAAAIPETAVHVGANDRVAEHAARARSYPIK